MHTYVYVNKNMYLCELCVYVCVSVFISPLPTPNYFWLSLHSISNGEFSTQKIIDWFLSVIITASTWHESYNNMADLFGHIQYIPRNMHTVTALLCFVVVIDWLIFPYPSGLLHWHCGNLTIAPVPAKQPWWIWINISCEFIMNDCNTTTKQSTTKPCACFLGYTVCVAHTAA